MINNNIYSENKFISFTLNKVAVMKKDYETRTKY